MTLNLPTLLTLSRIVVLPLLIGLLYLPFAWAGWIGLTLYCLCAATDFLDGWIARKYNQITALGTFLDPISDKIFVAALLVALVGTGHLGGIWIVPVIVILTREFVVSGLREYLGPKNVQIPVSKLAKWKTAVQMIAVGFLIAGSISGFILVIGQIGLTAAAVLTVMTGWDYLKGALPHLKD